LLWQLVRGDVARHLDGVANLDGVQGDLLPRLSPQTANDLADPLRAVARLAQQGGEIVQPSGRQRTAEGTQLFEGEIEVAGISPASCGRDSDGRMRHSAAWTGDVTEWGARTAGPAFSS